MESIRDTIFAQTSARGKAGISVFRISGAKAFDVLEMLTQKPLPNHGSFKLSNIYNFHISPTYFIDKAMVVLFKNPKSFTGEDVVEIHTHGSTAVCNMLLETLSLCKGLRLAEPGEFSKRAFFNNKMDLTQIEGVADLINAETLMQHRQASKQMLGELGKLYSSWKHQLTQVLALNEVYMDFPEEDLPLENLLQNKASIAFLKEQMLCHINDNRRGERLRSGISLGIFGEPNVGKSSLINCLTCRDISIVTNIAGTTRDVIEAHLDIGGYPIIASDTAGIRTNCQDQVENIGIKKAMELSNCCDIKIVLLDASSQMALDEKVASMIDSDTIIALNKSDIAQPNNVKNAIPISCKTQDGIKELTNAIITKAEKLAMPSSGTVLTRDRYRASIEKAVECMERALLNDDPILISEEIRLACNHIRALTGEVKVEDILEVIFANFCIGK